MIKIKLTDINDETEREYLKQNPEYSKQLVATLNQVDAFSPNELVFLQMVTIEPMIIDLVLIMKLIKIHL